MTVRTSKRSLSEVAKQNGLELIEGIQLKCALVACRTTSKLRKNQLYMLVDLRLSCTRDILTFALKEQRERRRALSYANLYNESLVCCTSGVVDVRVLNHPPFPSNTQ